MARNGMWRGGFGLAVVAFFVLLAGCNSDSAVEPDPALAPFVGDWDATAIVITSAANPDISPDLIQLGAQFSLNVQPSGQYTAILLYAAQSQTEVGTMSVSGGFVTMNRTFPTAATSTSAFLFEGNRLTLDGDTEFDFNLDGSPEPALAHFELLRQ